MTHFTSLNEYEIQYAKNCNLKVSELHSLGLYGVKCTCGEVGCEGWKMVDPFTKGREQGIQEERERVRKMKKHCSKCDDRGYVVRSIHGDCDGLPSECYKVCPIEVEEKCREECHSFNSAIDIILESLT
jgi:hypothetical protein